MAAGAEFVDGWIVAQVLGEGAYGEVRLLVQARTGAAVALKTVSGCEEAVVAATREATLQRALRHPHVLRCLGARSHHLRLHMFLEYAQGGELFERIEPDAGMAPEAAWRYWRQLLAGLRYLHARGVAHRDIKPENLLLDLNDNLKISDFGMATVFRQGDKERLISRVCGTVPYAAPEVLTAAAKPYRAPPADLWAAALVLLAMLAGELPWERADDTDSRYVWWCGWSETSSGEPRGLWRKVGPALIVLKSVLKQKASIRCSLEDLVRLTPVSGLTLPSRNADTEGGRVWCSQPTGVGQCSPGAGEGAGEGAGGAAEQAVRALVSHSQPAAADDLLLSTQPGAAAEQSVARRLVVRLSRVRVRRGVTCDAALRALTDALAARGLAWRRTDNHQLLIECGADVRMVAWAARGPAGACVEFRRRRGCGLQFRRRFAELRAALRHIALPDQLPPPEEHMDQS